MSYSLSPGEQQMMKQVIAQIAKKQGITESQVRLDITAMIMEGIRASQNDPAAQKRWQSLPCAGDIPTPEEFLFWISRRVSDELGQGGQNVWEINTK